MQPMINLRRIGEPDEVPSRRILVDRLWPRGVSHARADWDEWLKDVSPSTELRKWYGHEPERFAEFVRRYAAELEDDLHAAAFARLRGLAAEGPLTLLTASRTVERSHLGVLRGFLLEGVPDVGGETPQALP